MHQSGDRRDTGSRDHAKIRDVDPIVGHALRRTADRDNGERLFRQIYGDATDPVLQRLAAHAPTFREAVLEDAYGRILSRPGLAAADREWFAVAALTALDCPQQLKSHVRGALRLGVPPSDLAALPHLLRADLPTAAITKLTRLLDEFHCRP